MNRSLYDLPKAHLHVHLEGAMRASTLTELASQSGTEVPPTRGFGSFTAFAAMYLAACEVMTTEDHLRRLVAEVVEDAAQAGAVWVEPAVHLPNHRERLGPDEAVLEILLDATSDAARACGVGVGIMLAADRTAEPDAALAQARLAARYAGSGVVAFGLANDESRFPPEPFGPAFRVARDAGLLSTPHAGELAGPESVAGALDTLGAHRIQHGVRAVEDEVLVRRLADSGVCLDVCPTSNVSLSVFPSLEAHPLPALLEAGVRCSVNADDPLLFGPGLLEEYELCRNELDFDDHQMAEVALASVEASGAPAESKRSAAAGIADWLRAAHGR